MGQIFEISENECAQIIVCLWSKFQVSQSLRICFILNILFFCLCFTSVGCQYCVCWLSVSHRDPQGCWWPSCAKCPPAWMLLMSILCCLALGSSGGSSTAWGPTGTFLGAETWRAHPNWHISVSSNTKYPVPNGWSLSPTTWNNTLRNRVYK